MQPSQSLTAEQKAAERRRKIYEKADKAKAADKRLSESERKIPCFSDEMFEQHAKRILTETHKATERAKAKQSLFELAMTDYTKVLPKLRSILYETTTTAQSRPPSDTTSRSPPKSLKIRGTLITDLVHKSRKKYNSLYKTLSSSQKQALQKFVNSFIEWDCIAFFDKIPSFAWQSSTKSGNNINDAIVIKWVIDYFCRVWFSRTQMLKVEAYRSRPALSTDQTSTSSPISSKTEDILVQQQEGQFDITMKKIITTTRHPALPDAAASQIILECTDADLIEYCNQMHLFYSLLFDTKLESLLERTESINKNGILSIKTIFTEFWGVCKHFLDYVPDDLIPSDELDDTLQKKLLSDWRTIHFHKRARDDDFDEGRFESLQSEYSHTVKKMMLNDTNSFISDFTLKFTFSSPMIDPTKPAALKQLISGFNPLENIDEKPKEEEDKAEAINTLSKLHDEYRKLTSDLKKMNDEANDDKAFFTMAKDVLHDRKVLRDRSKEIVEAINDGIAEQIPDNDEYDQDEVGLQL